MEKLNKLEINMSSLHEVNLENLFLILNALLRIVDITLLLQNSPKMQ